jgi:HAD superfamily hydrolase (TIGR01509 family)
MSGFHPRSATEAEGLQPLGFSTQDTVSRKYIRGIVFDLDGTLVDSQLDFASIRRDLGLPPGSLILESLANTPEGTSKDQMLQTLRTHELRGAERATLFPGVTEMLALLTTDEVPTAVLTRNSRECTDLVLERLGLRFSQVLTREDAPPKPDPTGLLHICRTWSLSPSKMAFFGDYVFDIEAGRAAGMTTVLYAPGALPAYANRADHVLRSFTEFPAWWEKRRR